MGRGALDLLGAIVVVALVTTIVSHPQSAKVIGAGGTAFTQSILAAQGMKPKGY